MPTPKTPPHPHPAARYRRLADRKDVDALVTSFPVPRALHRRLKVAAARLNWSLAELLRVSAEEWLARHEPQASRPRADS